MEEKILRGNAWMKDSSEDMQNKGHAEDDVGFARIGETGNHLRVKDAIDESRHSEDKAHERT
jgi:hypothetical protein